MPSRECFDRDAIDLFWEFITERHDIWVNRVVRDIGSPWTANEILQKYRFTNAYRELDPGTQYAIQKILECEAPFEDRVFNLLLYRLIGRSATHREIGFQPLDTFDPDTFVTALHNRQNAGDPVFTGAYVVSGYSQLGGADKIENVARLLGAIKHQLPPVAASITAADSLEAVYNEVRRLPGYGRFLAYQVTVDLLYPLQRRDGESLVSFSPDDWAIPGPGADRGLEVLLTDATSTDYLDAMQWFRANQVAEFDRLHLEFQWLRTPAGDPIRISLANIQNCLCEFYKYHKILNGTGQAHRRFRESNARSTSRLREIYAAYPVSTTPSHY